MTPTSLQLTIPSNCPEIKDTVFKDKLPASPAMGDTRLWVNLTELLKFGKTKLLSQKLPSPSLRQPCALTLKLKLSPACLKRLQFQ